jgi:hypothetical protein
MTLIETMVALGLLGLAAYFISSLMRNGILGQKTLQAQDDSRVLTDNIAQILSDTTACRNTLGGVATSGNPVIDPTKSTQLTNVLDNNMKVQYTLNTIYGNRSLTLKEMVIGGNTIDPRTNIQQWTPGPPPPAPPTGMAFVRVKWTQTGTGTDKGSGPQDLYRYFMVYVAALDAAGHITQCTAQSAGSANNNGYWTENPNKDIYNNNNGGMGKVGIGIQTPMGVLDVYAGAKHALVVDSASGDVGIGTASPVSMLHLQNGAGAANVTLESAQNGGSIALNLKGKGPTGTAQSWAVGMNVFNGADYEVYDNNAAAPRLSIQTGTGNVGVNQGNPQATLDVGGSIKPGVVPGAAANAPCNTPGALSLDSSNNLYICN